MFGKSCFFWGLREQIEAPLPVEGLRALSLEEGQLTGRNPLPPDTGTVNNGCLPCAGVKADQSLAWRLVLRGLGPMCVVIGMCTEPAVYSRRAIWVRITAACVGLASQSCAFPLGPVT